MSHSVTTKARARQGACAPLTAWDLPSGTEPRHANRKASALDLIPSGIRVNAICSGFVDTPMLAGALAAPESRAALCAKAPIGRIAAADEVAQTALFLTSDATSYMVGALLSVDGGVVIE